MLSNEYVLDMLKEIANEHSGDKRTKVAAGCYIDGILEYGVNHLAYELKDDDVDNRTALFYATMIHAEADLCSRMGNRMEGKTVYVTLFPCDDCAKKLIECKVKNVVVKEDRPTASYVIKAKELLNAAGIAWCIV